MKLPNAEQAVIADDKLSYLLSEEKSGGKDRFFKSFGFSVIQLDVLRAALLQHAHVNEVYETAYNDFGLKYIVRGELIAPDGRHPNVQTVWQIDHNQTVPYLVSAYPA